MLQDAAKKLDAPKGKVDVPNGALRDPLPLPTGEMCERKTDEKWKKALSQQVWGAMTKLGWNYEDKVRAMMTFIMEGDFNTSARGDADNGGSGGICGLHFIHQKPSLIEAGVMTKNGKIIEEKFNQPEWQIDMCLGKYAAGVKFYGYRDALHMGDICKDDKRDSKGKCLKVLKGKKTKAKTILPLISCK